MRVLVLEKVDMVTSAGVTQQGSFRGKRMSTSLLYHAFGLHGYCRIHGIPVLKKS
jgi:hypothetical protein